MFCRYRVFAVVLGLAAGCDAPHQTPFSAKLGGGWARRFEDVTVASGPSDVAAIFVATSKPTDTSILKIDPFGKVDPFGAVARPSRGMFSLKQDAQAQRAWVTTADSEEKNTLRSTRIGADGKTTLAEGVERIEVDPTPDGEVMWTWTLHDDIEVMRRSEAGVTTELEQAVWA